MRKKNDRDERINRGFKNTDRGLGEEIKWEKRKRKEGKVNSIGWEERIKGMGKKREKKEGIK